MEWTVILLSNEHKLEGFLQNKNGSYERTDSLDVFLVFLFRHVYHINIYACIG